MAKPRAYVETTIVSYLTAWLSRDLVMAAHQLITREWWVTCRERFDLVVSELVVREAGAGDVEAARKRLEVLATIPLLQATQETRTLAKELIRTGALPTIAADDAFHVAVAVTNGVNYLVTWNCRHIANGTMLPLIEKCCRDAGYEPVRIYTPEQLMENISNDG
jgi:hypothetical protein